MDSTESIVGATISALDSLGMEGPDAESIRHVIGMSPKESFQKLFPGVTGDDALQLRKKIRDFWLTDWRDKNRLIDGAERAIDELSEEGYLLAVATGKGRNGLRHDMERAGLTKRFLASRTADDAASKPHPEMLLSLLDELGARPEETLMIGDTTFDLEMAQNAGCASIGVLTGSHDRTLLMTCSPLAVLDSVGDLPAWLREGEK